VRSPDRGKIDMKSFTDLFIKRPVLAMVVSFVILIAGLQAMKTINIRQYPRSDIASIQITTVYVGADAELVRGFITTPLERAIAAADGIDYIQSQSQQSLSTINVRLDSIQKEPEVVRGFVKGMVKGLKFLYANPPEAAEIAKKQFPTMALDDLKATLDRSFSDQMWSKDGMISKEAWATGSAVVREAGILKTDVKYEEIIDMSFVESVRASL
jgi:hypothetical protein